MPAITRLTDLAAPELAVYATLSEKDIRHLYEPDGGLFVAESPKVTMRALDAGIRPVSLLISEKQLYGESEAAPLVERLSQMNVPFYTGPEEMLKDLTGLPVTRGVLCAMERPDPVDPETLLETTRRVAVLERVTNPTNVGAIIRSAAALGVDAVLLTPSCADPLYRRAIRVSMGTVFQVPWAYLPQNDGAAFLPILKKHGFASAAMALKEDSVSVADAGPRGEEKLAIWLGEEGYGLADATIAGCDYTVLIPMTHGVDSLNVAAASAVAFWELAKKD